MIKITNNIKKFVNTNERIMDSVLGRMTGDILMISKITVPFKSSDLMRSGVTEKVGSMKYKVRYDSEYASYQERGRRQDGSRVVRNYTTPGTGKNFLRNAGKTVANNALNYLRQGASSVRV
jgi:hypothetical protein